MAHVNNARQWQRFAYPADVQLAVLGEEPIHDTLRDSDHDVVRAEHADSAEPAPVLKTEREREPETSMAIGPTAATAVDLSLGGVQLALAQAPRVGSAVTCRLPDGHDSLTLRGHVRWASSAKPNARIGVQFEPLSARARQILQTLLSQAEHAGELVRVHLPNWTQPLQGVALLSDRGVRLRVPLPSFVHGSTIKFDQLEGERSLEGRVVRTQLRVSALTQGLELDLSLEPCEPARKRRYMVYEPNGPDDPSPAHAHEAPRHEDIVALDDAGAAPLIVPKRRVHLALAGGAAVACALWVGLTLMQSSSRRAAMRRSNNHATHAVTTPMSSALKPPALPLTPEAVSRSETIADLPSATAAAPDPAANLPAAAVSAGDGVSLARPQVSTTGDTSEFFVPLLGSSAGTRVALWVDPPAVVVDIPNGHVAWPQSRYTLQTGGIVGLSVGKPRGVTQLRVYLRARATRYWVSETPGGITLHVKR
jgi:hypothetical protein